MPPRLRAVAALLVGLAALASAGILWTRLRPPSAAEREARRGRMIHAAAQALQADAARMARVAAAIQDSREFSAIVDGGGAEVRPSRLFAVLGRQIPAEKGWGAVYYDASDRAIAWTGETGSPEAAPAAVAGAWSSFFHVTRFSLALASPRMAGQESRGALVVSRTYPTGLLRPDLVDMLSLSGGPSRMRLRAEAPSAGHGLVSLRFEEGAPGVEEEDASRAGARPFALAAAVSLLLFSLLPTRWASLGVVASRLAFLAGAPIAEKGIWAPLLPVPSGFSGLLGTPADLFLSGMAALFLVWREARREGEAHPGRLLMTLSVAAAVLVASLPYLLARASASAGFLPSGGLDLVPEGFVSLLVRAGGVAFVAGLLAGAAYLFRRSTAIPVRGLPAAGIVLLSASLLFPGRPGAPLLAVPASLLLAYGLSRRLGAARASDLLGRLTTGVFLLAAAAALAGAGLSDGRFRYLDRLLEGADVHPGKPGERDLEELPANWEGRISRRSLLPWLPAGSRTGTTDLARALWIRGADRDYPRADDLLTVRDAEGRVASSFGLVRPGAERRGMSVLTELPLEGFAGVFTRLDSPTEEDRDPVLSAVVEEDVGPRPTLERIDYDAAGRPMGISRDRPEIPARLLEEAARSGSAAGMLERGETGYRVHLRAAPAGFVALLVPSEGALATIGSAAAAAEGSLPLLLPFLVPPGRRRSGPTRRETLARFRLQTFRGRLVLLLFLSSAVPLAGSVFAVRAALERHSFEETRRRSLNLLLEARRALEASEEDTPSETELNRAAAVLGTDLLLYRDGRLVAASRALPVAAGIAGERLPAAVAEKLAEGKGEASALAATTVTRGKVLEAALPMGRNPRETIAAVVLEDEAARVAVDGLFIFAVAAALVAFGLGGRAALTLSRPIEDVTRASRRIGSGETADPIERPRAADLAELVEAFEGMAGQVRDRTELLAKERAAAVGLLSNLTAAVLLFRERDREVAFANPRAEELLPGGNLDERMAPEIWEPLRSVVAREEADRKPAETRIAVRQGETDRVFRVVVAPLAPDGGEQRSALLLEDLTAFLRAERLTAWVEATRAIAHDIKNPLTPIRLSAERLLRPGHTDEPGRVEAAAKTILRQVGVLTERIGRLGRFSDPSRHPGTLDRAEFEQLLGEIRADFSATPAVRVDVSVPSDLPPVAADREPLRDALTNLVVNSVEALAGRGGTILLSVRTEDDQPGRPVRITCTDDGPGVAEPDLERIFDPSFSTKSRGSGMGLAASRRAIEALGGTVFAERRAGGGLSIAFRLPRSPLV